MEKPVIVCGLGRVGRRVLDYLRAAGLPLVVIDSNADPDDPAMAGARLVRGDARRREVLQEAGVAQARGVLVLTSDDLVNVSVALMIRALAADVRIVLRVFNENLIVRLGQVIKNLFPLSTSSLTAPLLAAKALTGQALGAVKLNDERRQIAQITVADGSSLCGQTLAQVANQHEAKLVAYLPAQAPPEFLGEVNDGHTLRVGDTLVICGDPRRIEPLLAHGEGNSNPLRWASFVRRHLRALFRTLGEVDTSVKVCGAVLVSVVVTSVVIFHFVAHAHGAADSLYRTISLIATGADMKADTYPDELKVYTSLLRLIGAALTAAFTAILTNYLVRASLGGALEVRRIPDGGHVLVCGLGTIGYRVVDELNGVGARVVAIEVNRDNRFVATVRRKGVPVILGDAVLSDVLRQAHANTARAVIVTTSDDLINLEVALLCRELNPSQRVILLQADPQLALLLREAAQVRFAVSVPALAAPAFVAGLFGDRVQGVVLVGDRLLAVVDLDVWDSDAHLVGQSVRAVAVDWRLLPVAVLPAGGGPPVRSPLNARLGVGDRLIAILHLADLETLLKRQAVPRDWAVDVLAWPPASRDWLQLMVGSTLKLDEADARAAMARLPLRLQNGLTRGEAEDLLALLRRERIEARAECCQPC